MQIMYVVLRLYYQQFEWIFVSLEFDARLYSRYSSLDPRAQRDTPFSFGGCGTNQLYTRDLN